MSEYKLMNDEMTLTVSTKGAEIRSLKKNTDGREYMWQADPAFWGWTAPVLFPVVGAFRNGEYRFEGKTYHMPQHGFARRSEFVHKPVEGSELGFVLTESPDTLKDYPFCFRLEVGYTLQGRSVNVRWRVLNTGEETMYFSIGAHPAFNCPPTQACRKNECLLSFNAQDKLTATLLNLKVGNVSDQTMDVALKDGMLPIADDLFDIDTLIVENGQAGEVSLNAPDQRPYVTVSFDAPLFGVWSPSKDAPFVCLEPWYGLADHENFSGDLSERKYEQRLEPQAEFTASYKITVA